ncbi:hypothetical protein X975_08097, partial [Stegodyphus mimosarum]
MKVLAIVLLMAVAAMAQYHHGGYAPSHQVVHVQPAAYSAGSQGHAYGAYGKKDSLYDAHGRSHYGDHGRY